MADSIHDRAMREVAAGRVDAALAAVRLHLKIRPKDIEAMALLGELLSTAGQFDLAVQQFSRLLAMQPDSGMHRYNLANALIDARRVKEGIVELERLRASEPDNIGPHLALAVAYVEVDATDKAIEAGRRAMQLDPTLAAAAGNLSYAYTRAGMTEEAYQAAKVGVDANPNEPKLRSMMLLAMNYTDATPEAIAQAHREYARVVGPPVRPARTDPDPERPIRVGLLSGDMRDHSVSFFVEPFLRHADPRVSFEIFSNSAPQALDATSKRLRGHAAAWHDCGHMPHNAIDAFIRSRNIDVLLELGGHSGEPRLLALIEKPAPVVISAIGYPNTTGVPAIEWRLVDAITDPVGSERFCTEQLLRIDPCFLCYTAPTNAPEPAMPDASQPITFGSFNNATKIGARSVELWARVLQAVPGSRLLMKAQSLTDSTGRKVILERFAAAGIAPDRLELVAYTKTRDEHLRLYNRVHVALDTVPYNGTTTTCEALWMGVPVVTTLGDRHAARVSASLLHAAGHPELVASDADAFVRIAASLAQDRPRLDALRTSLRAHMAASPLMDAPGYAARFHAAVRACWQTWCSQQKRA